MTKINLVLVGPGLIGLKHIDLIVNSEEADLKAIVAPYNIDNIRIAKSHGVPIYQSIGECIAREKPDGVIISSPNQFHYEQASFCISKNIPVLIEKPLTVNLSEGRDLVQLVHRYNAKVLVGHHRVYSPLLATAKEAINSGRLGRLVSIIGSAQFYKPAQYFKDGPWRTEPGGGPILINMIHEVGNLRTLVGEIKSVHAISSSSVRNFLVEDTVAMNFIFENGVLGTFLLSDTSATAKSWEQTSRENPGYSSYSDEDCYTIAGTLGSLSFPTMRLKYYASEVEPSWCSPFTEEVLPTTRLDPLRLQLEHFVRVIQGNERPLVSATDGFKNLLITEAIKKSIETRSLVEIEE